MLQVALAASAKRVKMERLVEMVSVERMALTAPSVGLALPVRMVSLERMERKGLPEALEPEGRTAETAETVARATPSGKMRF